MPTTLDELLLVGEHRGQPDGVASLDSGGKVPSAQLPAAIVGALQYQGTWNATSNSPAIPAAASGNKGHYYVVATAGATSIDGVTDWKIGDWLVSNGATWDKIDTTDQVASVAGRTGVVTLLSTDPQFSATDKLLGRATAGAGSGEEIALTAAGRALIDDAAASDQRTTLGLGTAATHAHGDYDVAGAAAAAAAASQPLDAELTTLSSATAAGLALMDDADATAQRTTLGLGTAATHAHGDYDVAGAAAAAQAAAIAASQPLAANLTALAAATTPAILRIATATLTDAQIKASPTTEIDIVAAPGAGIVLVPLVAIIQASVGGGAYTNINAAAYLSVFWGAQAGWPMSWLEEDGGLQVTALLATGTTRLAMLGPGGQYAAPTSDAANKALTVAINNAAGGDLTGGNAANTLEVTVIYVAVTL